MGGGLQCAVGSAAGLLQGKRCPLAVLPRQGRQGPGPHVHTLPRAQAAPGGTSNNMALKHLFLRRPLAGRTGLCFLGVVPSRKEVGGGWAGPLQKEQRAKGRLSLEGESCPASGAPAQVEDQQLSLGARPTSWAPAAGRPCLATLQQPPPSSGSSLPNRGPLGGLDIGEGPGWGISLWGQQSPTTAHPKHMVRSGVPRKAPGHPLSQPVCKSRALPPLF